MKRGLIFIFLFVFLVFTTLVMAYNGYGYGYGFNWQDISVAELAHNEMLNVILLFLLFFTVLWFILQQVFRAAKGAGIIASLVIALMASFGIVSYYGPVIPTIGPWITAVFVIIVLIGLFRIFRGIGYLKWILLAIALIWLVWGRKQVCYLGGPLMEEACIIMDFFAIAIAILVILGWIISKAFKLRGEEGWAPTYERPAPAPRGPRIPVRIGRKIKGAWQRSKQSEAWKRKEAAATEAWKRKEVVAAKAAKKYDKLVRGAERRARISRTEARQQRYLNLARKLERRRDMEIRRAPIAVVRRKRAEKAAEEARIKEKARKMMEKEKRRHIRRARRAEKLRRRYAAQQGL